MKTLFTGILLLSLSVIGIAQRLDPNFTPQFMREGFLERVVATPDGKAIIAGNFSSVGSSAENGLARITADGLPDLTFNPSSIEPLTATAVGVQADGKVLINVMGFDENGDRNGKLVRLLNDGSPDSTFMVQEFTGKWVSMIKVLPNQRIFVAFNSLLPGPASFGVGLFEPDGMPVADFPVRDFGGGRAFIFDIFVQSNDALLVFGLQLNYGGEKWPAIRLSASGEVDESFRPAYLTENEISSLGVAVTPAGEIGVINQRTGQFAWLDSMGVTRYTRNLDVGDVFQLEMLAVENDGILIIGENLITQYQSSFGVTQPGIGIGKNMLARASALLPGNQVLVGGVFDAAQNRLVTGLASYRFNSNSTLFTFDESFTSAVFRPAYVRDIEVQSDGAIIATGDFLSVNGVRKPYLARIDSEGILDNSFPSFTPSEKGRALASYDDGSLLFASEYSPQASGLFHFSADGALISTVGYSGISASGSIAEAVALSNNSVLVVDASSRPSSVNVPNGDQPIYRYQLNQGVITEERLNELYLDSIRFCLGIGTDATGLALLHGNRIAYDGGAPAPIVRLLANGRRDETFSAGDLANFVGVHLSVNSTGSIFLGARGQDVEPGTPFHHLLLINADGSMKEDLTERFTPVNVAVGPQITGLVQLGDGQILVMASATAYDGISVPSGQFILDTEGELVDEYLEELNIRRVENAVASDEGYYLAGEFEDDQLAGVARVLPSVASTSAYQPTAIENAKWFLVNSETSFFPNMHFVVSANGDTIVEGVTYKKLYREVIDFIETQTSPRPLPPYELLPGKALIALIRDESATRRTYGRLIGNDGFSEEVLLHDYSTPVGEQMKGYGFDQTFPLTVETVEVLPIYGETRLTQSVGGLNFYEGVGSGEFGPLSGGSDVALNCCLFWLFDYCVGDYASCNIVSSVIRLPSGGRIDTYPSPFFNQIDLEVSNVNTSVPVTVRLRDLSGRILREGTVRNRLRWSGLDDLASGMYFITYVIDGKVYTEKLIHR